MPERRNYALTIMEEIRELHELNLELIETLTIVGQRFIEYIDKYEIKIEGRETLALLIRKAKRLTEEIGTPYRGNPVTSDGFIHPKSSDEDSPKPVPRS